MKKIILHGRSIIGGIAEGEAIVTKYPLNFGEAFFSSILSESDHLYVDDPTHDLYGKEITNKIFIYPTQHGSTGVSGEFLETVRRGLNPKAIVCNEIDNSIAVGVILANKILNCKLPTIDTLSDDPTKVIETGDYVRVDGDNGIVEIMKMV